MPHSPGWLWNGLPGGFPRAFQRHWAAFVLATVVMLVGAGFGGFAITFDIEAKQAMVPAQFTSLELNASGFVALSATRAVLRLPDAPGGLPVAVADAMDVVKEAAFYVTEQKGGQGAVRELIDLLLAAKA